MDGDEVVVRIQATPQPEGPMARSSADEILTAVAGATDASDD